MVAGGGRKPSTQVAAGGENADGPWSTPQQVDRGRVYVIPPP